MSKRKKRKNLETKRGSTELTFSLVIYILSMDHLGFSTLFSNELAPATTSLFKDNEDER